MLQSRLQSTLGRTVINLRAFFHFRRRLACSSIPGMADGKLDSPQFAAILTPELIKLESLFKREGYGFRLVGGVVRDMLLGSVPKDIDIATDCTPDVMMQLFKANGIRYIPTGLQHGTITVHMESGKDYEVWFYMLVISAVFNSSPRSPCPRFSDPCSNEHLTPLY